MRTKRLLTIAGILVFAGSALWINWAVKSNPPPIGRDWEPRAERRSTSAGLEEDEEAPLFTLEDTEGNSVSLADLRGNVVVMDFWATWYGPCRMAMSTLQGFHERYADRGVVVLGINQQESLESVQDFLKENHYTYSQLLDPDGEVAGAYGVVGIPTLVIIDQEGNFVRTHEDYDPRLTETLLGEVEPLLKE